MRRVREVTSTNPAPTRYWHHWASQSSGQCSGWAGQTTTVTKQLWASCLLSLAWSVCLMCSLNCDKVCTGLPRSSTLRASWSHMLQARDKRSVSSLPAHTKFTSACPITLLISLPPVIIPFSMMVCDVGLLRGSVCEGCDHPLDPVYNCIALSTAVPLLLVDFPISAVCLLLY